ncbi:ABC transporter ATP-binding protein [Streptomyces sp. NPDC057654]|uniref:ABC transporter ATP-binding protein n=1 Tax=Streptomyces sp. NPDC057654 TaxID=3346196 RepID=UPI00367595D6
MSFTDLRLLVAFGLSMVWRASPRRLTVLAGLQIVQAAGLGVTVLIGRNALAGLTGTASTQSLPLHTYAGYVALLLAVRLVNNAARQAADYQQSMIRLAVERDAVERVVTTVSAYDLAEFERPAFHNRVRLVMTAAQAHLPQLPMLFVSVLSVASTAITLGAVLATMAWWLVPLLAVAGLPMVRVTLWQHRAIFALDTRLTESSRARWYLIELLTGREQAKEIRAFGLTTVLFTRLSGLYDRVMTEEGTLKRRLLRRETTARLASDAIIGAALATVLAAEAAQRLGTASALTAIACLFFAAQQGTAVSTAIGSVNASAYHIDALRTFTARPPRKPAAAVPSQVGPPFGVLEARNVSFTYPAGQRPAVDGVSVKLRAGETIALVGVNGSGKTTLTKLLAGLYRPDAGELLIDGESVTDPTRLTALSTVLFQDYLRYWMTAGENIALGAPEHLDDIDRTVRAARQAGIHDIVSALPSGYLTKLGPQFRDGADLSLGQWQRIALARAFFRDAPLIILDEPTSSMDACAEAELFERMRALFTGRTVLLISHRFSSVLAADRIYVLDHGKVIESGTHQHLMALEGVYHRLYRAQADAYQDVSPSDGPR